MELQPYYMPEPSYSVKQSEQLAVFEDLVRTYGINLHINEPLPDVQEIISLDVEHDESGGFVGIGCYVGTSNSHYWYTDTLSLDSSRLSSLPLVLHNGVSDLDTLRSWGFQVDDSQIAYDTMLMGHIIDSSLKAYGLKDMVKRDLGIEYPDYDAIVGKRTEKQKAARVTLDQQPPRLVQLYNVMDCFVTAKEMEYQLGRIY